ncbi:hypothetical protein VNI00_007915 [Paramarasmius palmivorus]|uniref:TauD/TfdA-like domain-containing protein n=1 Tax=Paramarasmius palmivorus TaxID=297713 RepID=A0AAW0D062_9AGAR
MTGRSGRYDRFQLQRDRLERVDEFQPFISAAAKRIPTGRKALHVLRQLQPPAQCPDISNPPSHLLEALEALAAIANHLDRGPLSSSYASTVSLVKENWSPCIAPWLKFFIENVVLSEIYSSSIQGERFLVNVLYIVPLLLSHPDGELEWKELKENTPYIPTLVARTWLKLLDSSHISQRRWSFIICSAFFTEGLQFSELLVKIYSAGLHHVVKTLVARVYTVAHDLHVSPVNLDRLKLDVRELLMITSCGHEASPMFVPFLREGGNYAYMAVLSALFTNPKAVRRLYNTQELFHSVGQIASLAIKQISQMINGPLWLLAVLEGGLVKLISNAGRFRAAYESLDLTGKVIPGVFKELVDLLEHICQFLVYPSILRVFLHVAKRVPASKSESLKAVPVFWRAWENTLQRADALHRVYHHLKTIEYGSICAHQQALSAEGQRFFEAISISSLLSLCPRLMRELKDSRPSPSHIDITFFRELVKSTVIRNAREIDRIAARFTRRSPSHGMKRNMFIINMNALDMNDTDPTLSMSNITEANLQLIMSMPGPNGERAMSDEQLKEVVRVLSTADERQVVAIAIFPTTRALASHALQRPVQPHARTAGSAAALRPRILQEHTQTPSEGITADDLPIVSMDDRRVAVGWDTRTWSRLKILWGAKISQSPPIVRYEEVMAEDGFGLYKWLQNIFRKDRFGFSFVSDVPVSPEATEELTQKIGFIRETQYGKFWEFTSDLSKGDTAYTTMALGAHTDNTYFTDPCGLQLFHLLSHTEGSGGATLLVDGFYVASILKEIHPEAYSLLSRIPVPAHAAGEKNSLYRPSPPSGYPVLSHDVRTGEIAQVRWNNDDRSAMRHLSGNDVEDW